MFTIYELERLLEKPSPQLDDFNEFSEPMHELCQARGEWLSEQVLIPQLLDTKRALEAKQARIKAARETIEREFDAAIVSGDEDFHRGWLAGYLKALTSIEGDSE